VLRLLGKPDPGLLEAALEPPDAQATQDLASSEPPEKLLPNAIAVCFEAHELWQRLTSAHRTQVRGFSLPLLGLAIDQTLLLERAIAEHGALSAEHQVAVARLRELAPRCGLLCSQAAQVLEKVAGEPRSEDEGPLVASETTFALAQSLHRLAHAGQELLRSTNVAVRRRAMLYGLNEAFLDGLAAAGAELVRVNEKACSTGPLQESQRALAQAHRATFLLVTQVAEAFATAHRIDPQIPALATVLTKPRRVELMAPRPAPRAPEPREAHVVVLAVEDPKRTLLAPYAPRVLEAGDLGASGVIRKRSKPPLR
jgi:hypothetical protein